MPDVTKGLQELVSSLNGKLTAMTSRPKQTIVVFYLKKKKHKAKWDVELVHRNQLLAFF